MQMDPAMIHQLKQLAFDYAHGNFMCVHWDRGRLPSIDAASSLTERDRCTLVRILAAEGAQTSHPSDHSYMCANSRRLVVTRCSRYAL